MLLVRYLSLLSLLATVAWFFWNPVGWEFQWEPIVVFFASLAIFLNTDLQHKKKKTVDEAHPADVELFARLKLLLPSTGVIRFLKEHDFMGSFNRKTVDPLDDFRLNWDNAEHQFIDEGLESLREILYKKSEEFYLEMARLTSPNDAGFQAVVSDRVQTTSEKPWSYWEKKFQGEAKILNGKADELVEAHQNLVAAATRKLR